MQLTAKQEKVLESIQRHIIRYGEAPSYRAIAANLGLNVKTVNQHIQALERKGVLERTGGSIRLEPDYLPEHGIPILGDVAAGSPILAIENIDGYMDLDKTLWGQDTDEHFLLRVHGDSMIDAGILDGDLVLVKKMSEVPDGEIAAVIIGDEATVKRIKRTGSAVTLLPANRKYKPIKLTSDSDVRIAGKVIMSMRKF